jgi:squalene-associated FAD-dependent desaturase
MPVRRGIAVIGGGWAGLAAAIEATRLGADVTLFEMAGRLGGRARALDVDGIALDNGQHICIGAYTETLRLMATVGIAEDSAFLRLPLRVQYPDGAGLELRGGPPLVAFAGAVWRHPRWRPPEKAALLVAATRWLSARFRCAPELTVARLTERLPLTVRTELIDPLCVAALNTPASEASARVFLRVLGDALFSGRGSADLLLPRISLGAAFPEPALRWLGHAGATLRLNHRVAALVRDETRWRIDGDAFDEVVMAASPVEAARLVGPLDSTWAAAAAALRYEPIVTVYLRSVGTQLPQPMLALHADAAAPAQFVFDRGRLGGPAGLLAFVVSGAADWVAAGSAATLDAIRRQAMTALGDWLQGPLETVQVVTEKRATFRCTPGLQRPPMLIAPGLVAAGDHVAGPYPSTLEGAVRSGVAAARAIEARSAGSPA